MSKVNRIKKKIIEHDSKKWWGDDFDVRFYLISKIKNLKNKSILDVHFVYPANWRVFFWPPLF